MPGCSRGSKGAYEPISVPNVCSEHPETASLLLLLLLLLIRVFIWKQQVFIFPESPAGEGFPFSCPGVWGVDVHVLLWARGGSAAPVEASAFGACM